MAALLLGIAFLAWAAHRQARHLESLDAGIGILKREIDLRGRQVADIQAMRHAINELLARKLVRDTLQAPRAEAVRLLDFLAMELPADLVLTEVRRDGRSLVVHGTGWQGAAVLRDAMTRRPDVFAQVEIPAAHRAGGDPPAGGQPGFVLRAHLRSAADRAPSSGHGASEPAADPVDGSTSATVAVLEKHLLQVGLGAIVVLVPSVAIFVFIRRRRRRLQKAPNAGGSITSPFAWIPLTLLAAFVAAAVLVVHPRHLEIEAKNGLAETLREDLVAVHRLWINQDQLRAQRAELERTMAALQRQLPDAFDSTSDATTLGSLARHAGLSRLALRPGDEEGHDFFAGQVHRISAAGSYDQIRRFFAAAGEIERLVAVGDFHVLAFQDRLALDAEILFFRYRDPRQPSGRTGGAKP